MEKTGLYSGLPKNANGYGYGYSNYPGQSYPQFPQPNPEDEEEGFQLEKFVNIIKRRLLLIAGVSTIVIFGAGFWTIKQKPLYVGSFQMLVEPVESSQTTNQLLATGSSSLDYSTQIQILRSSRVLEPILEKITKENPGINAVGLYGGQLSIRKVGDTKILEISYQDIDPERIKILLDYLAEGYVNYSIQERKSDIGKGIEFVGDQLPKLKQRVDSLQEQLQKFRQSHNLIDPQQQAGQLLVQMNNLEQQYFNTQLEINEATTQYGIIQQQLGLNPEQALVSSYLSEAPGYQQLLGQIQDIEVKLAIESARFNDNSPTIQALRDQQQNLLPLLYREAQIALGGLFSEKAINDPVLALPNSLRLQLNQQLIQAVNQIKILEMRRGALEKAAIYVNQQFKQMPILARKYTDLQRELKVATDSLDRFLEAQERLEIEASQKALPWQILIPPQQPNFPISPNYPRNWTMGILAGLALGIAAALLAERLDPVFHSVEELKENIRLPVVGFIPYQKGLSPRNTLLSELSGVVSSLSGGDSSTSKKSRSDYHSYSYTYSFIEAFRSLNTNLRLLGSDTPIRSFVVSSASPGEGKSTTSVHLAQTAATMGQRVLLIDADLRRPQVHSWLSLPNTQGLSNVIATGLELELAIQRVPQWDNLSVLTAGDIPPDPTRLLASKRMQQLIEYVVESQTFDLIIYDSPPVLGFADARILASLTNGLMLVMRMGKTDKVLLKQTVEDLNLARVSILGLVANQVSRHAHYSSNYYDHYYSQNSQVVS